MRKITIVEKCGRHIWCAKREVAEALVEGGFVGGCTHGMCRVKPGLDTYTLGYVADHPSWVEMPQSVGVSS